MRFIEDLQKKEVIGSDAKIIGKISDVIFDEDTFEITDVVVKKTGIADSIKSPNHENIVPIEIIGTIGDKIIIKDSDEI